MRSLAPSHEDYQGIFTGNRYARDGAYHQGTVWSWLIGPFVEAHYNIYHDRDMALSYLRPFEQHLHDLVRGQHQRSVLRRRAPSAARLRRSSVERGGGAADVGEVDE